MRERLQQLQRQQALIREHLAWIDAEIAKESTNVIENTFVAAGESSSAHQPVRGADSELTSPASATQSKASDRPVSAVKLTAPTRPIPSPLSEETQSLINQYLADESSQRDDARRGCLIIFAVALTALILGVAAVWWFGYRKPI